MTAVPPLELSCRAGLRVVIAEGADRWDQFVRLNPASTVAHLWGWRRIMERVLGHDCRYLAATDDHGNWHGVLPLVRVESFCFGHYVVSMPFLNQGGPVGTEEARERLAASAILHTRRRGSDLLELRSREPVPGTLLTRSHRKITVILDLPADPETLWRSFSSKLRSQIRRPMKEGYQVRYGPEVSGAFYQVFARHMRDLGTPALPAAFFSAISQEFPEDSLFAAVYHGDAPIAGGAGFFWRDEFEITWASALREYNRTAPNMLLYWSLMEHAITRGARRFNFGRCTPGGSTHAFKRQWGGQDVVLPWARWSWGRRTAPPTPDRPVYRFAGRVWQRLPLTLTNTCGPRLARLIP